MKDPVVIAKPARGKGPRTKRQRDARRLRLIAAEREASITDFSGFIRSRQDPGSHRGPNDAA